MKRSILGKILPVVCGSMLLCSFDLTAQFSSFLDGKIQRRDRSKPTFINAESMDIDINNNRVTLIGNVDVDDPEMNIKCRKMIIHLSAASRKDKKKASSAAPEKNAPKKKRSGNELDRELEKIECIGEVVISRSVSAGKNDKGPGDIQRAYAGEAVYHVKEEKIVLKDNPVVVSAQNRLAGEVITLFPKTERILILKPQSRIRGGIGNVSGSMKRK